MATVVLACPGPSLKEERSTLKEAQRRGFYVYGCNQACITYPNLVGTLLVDQARCFNLKKTPFPKGQIIHVKAKAEETWKDEGFKTYGYPTIRGVPKGLGRSPFDGKLPLIWHSQNESLNNGVLFAVQVLYYAGVSRILLVGSELQTDKGIYAHGQKDYVREAKQKIYDKVINRFKTYRPMIGDRLIYCTPTGALKDVFPTMSLAEAID